MTSSLDPLSRAYIDLAFGIERHNPGTVDAYLGPPDLRDAAMAGATPTPAALLEAANSLLTKVEQAELEPSRLDYLSAQVLALQTQCRVLNGEELAYQDEVQLYLDISPDRTPEAVYDEAITALDDALTGAGPVAERMVAWRAQFEISPGVAEGMIATIAAEVRARSQEFAPLPAGEAIDVKMVSDKPWSGYNWYLGDMRSLIEINTDLPIRANALLDLICHEGYPGHHSEHAIKERRLYREQGFGEHAIQLINTPECVISEGIATLAGSIIFGPREASTWRAEHLYAPIGLTIDPAREARIEAAQANLRSVGGNAALLLHKDGAAVADVVAYLVKYGLETEERARHRMRFLQDPIWRPYIFTYHAGRDLLARWLDRNRDDAPSGTIDDATRRARFGELLVRQVTPSLIAGELEA